MLNILSILIRWFHPPVLGVIDPGTAAVASSVIGGVFGGFGQSSANKANAREARLTREFNERLARNKYQYETQDLKKAGLNRILAVTQGATQGSSSAQGRHENVGKAVTEGAQLAQLQATVRNINKDTELKQTAADKNSADTVIATQNAQMQIPELTRSKNYSNYLKSSIGKGLDYWGRGTKDAFGSFPLIGISKGFKGSPGNGAKGAHNLGKQWKNPRLNNWRK